MSVNGYLESSNYDFNEVERNGYFEPPMPKHDTSVKEESNFDSFRYHNKGSLKIYTYNDDGYDNFSDPINLTKCK